MHIRQGQAISRHGIRTSDRRNRAPIMCKLGGHLLCSPEGRHALEVEGALWHLTGRVLSKVPTQGLVQRRSAVPRRDLVSAALVGSLISLMAGVSALLIRLQATPFNSQ